jgi:hypothetical protein
MSIAGVAMVTTTKLEAAVALRSAARRVDLNCIVVDVLFVELKIFSIVYLIMMVSTVVTDMLRDEQCVWCT